VEAAPACQGARKGVAAPAGWTISDCTTTTSRRRRS